MAKYSVVELRAEPRRLDRQRVAETLLEHRIRYDIESEPHVLLRPSQPFVQDRGYLNFIGNWHYFADPPSDNAAWVRAIAPASAGRLEIWLSNVTPGKMYLVAIDVMCGVGGPAPAYKVTASDAASALVNAQPPDQTLLVVITPTMDLSLVVVEPQDLDSWLFFSAEVTALP